jgi:hypothetical protein
MSSVKDNEKTLFVFYTSTPNSDSWAYSKFPKGWGWVGAGSTSPVGGAPLKYQREEQFSGPAETQAAMKELLTKKFDALKKAGTIAIYKIRNSYSP